MKTCIRTLIAVFLIIFLNASQTPAQDYLQLSSTIHVHSTYSSGQLTLEELVVKAKNNGIDVLVLTDHDLVVMEYGLFPLRNLLKKREERKSIIKTGPEKYLAAIERINRQQKSVIVIPGVQSSPFYYWTGSPFKGDLTAHDYRKELLVIGMNDPDDYNGLPLLHRGFSTSYTKILLPNFLFFLIPFIVGIYLLFQKGAFRIVGSSVAVLGLAFLINHHPFQSSRYDPYHGDQGIAPFQELIDYVRQQGGLVYWAHPESNYPAKGVALGPITLKTEPYPDALVESKNYTGFSAVYGDKFRLTNPGMHWDRALFEYCEGQRAQPAWGIAGADYHTDEKGPRFDTYQTIIFAREKSAAAVLEALERGRIYAVRKSGSFRLSLDRFHVIGGKQNQRVVMGDELLTGDGPLIEGQITATDGKKYPIKVALIKKGSVWKTLEGKTPFDFRIVDNSSGTGRTFYRLEVRGPGSQLIISNPIFVTKS